MKVVQIITGLDTGGANTMLYKLVSCTDREAFETEVVSLIDIGPIGLKIQAVGIPVRAVGMRRGVPNPLAVLRLAHWLRQDPPHVIQTWTYHADLVGGLAARLAGGIPVAWGVHHTTFDPRGTKRMSIWTIMACARLSRWLPARIVCCSEASRRGHRQLGYAADKMLVITNGFDLALFGPDPAARQSVRRELGIPEEAPLIGVVARFHPDKDHRNFVQAAARLHACVPESHFLLCGDGITWENPELARWIEAAGIRDKCHLLGRREDIPRLTAALDIASSSSSGEAFPLVIGEAMACGVPCVATDVGESAIIVGNTGVVVPPKDPQALADGWTRLLVGMSREERRGLGLAARQRIKERYSLGKIVAQYERLYESLAAAGEPWVT
jgi:glycosyltransferase involved in cell wall biosynthesis